MRLRVSVMTGIVVVLCMSALLLSGAVIQISEFKFDQYDVVAIEDLPISYPAALFANDKGGADRKRIKKAYPRDSARSSLNVFLVRLNDKFILIDAGQGDRNSMLIGALEELHIARGQIAHVLLTHAHDDHIGGLLTAGGQKNFPNATVWISAAESTAMIRKGMREATVMYKRVQNAYRRNLRTFADGEEILPGLKAVLLPGHTAGHTMFVLKDTLRFIGSAILAYQWQLPEPGLFAGKIDEIPKASVDARKKLIDECIEKKWLLAGAHLPFPGLATIEKKKDGEGVFYKPYKIMPESTSEKKEGEAQ